MFLEFVAVVGDAAAGAAERKRRPDDERETADFFRHGTGLIQVVRGAGNGNVEADAEHELLERFAVLALVNRFRLRSDHFDAVFFQDAGAVQGHGGVQGGLSAERRK